MTTTGANMSWLTNRQTNPFAAAKALPGILQPTNIGSVIPIAARRIRTMPSNLILGMILLAALAICATVIYRSRVQLTASAIQHQRMSLEIDVIRRTNASLVTEIGRITTDPKVIESSARARLGMVRATDIVVPIDTLQSNSKSELVSFVR